jgi:hypothetical protein
MRANTGGPAPINKPLLGEIFEYLDQLPNAKVRALSFRFGLTDAAAREVLAAWSKTAGLASVDGRVDEAADSLSIS